MNPNLKILMLELVTSKLMSVHINFKETFVFVIIINNYYTTHYYNYTCYYFSASSSFVWGGAGLSSMISLSLKILLLRELLPRTG